MTRASSVRRPAARGDAGSDVQSRSSRSIRASTARLPTRPAWWRSSTRPAALCSPRPLVQRALEGATKRASGELIVRAYGRLAAELEQARDALGRNVASGTPAPALLRCAPARPNDPGRSARTRREPLPCRSPCSPTWCQRSPWTARPPPCSPRETGQRRGLVEFRRAVERISRSGASRGLPPAAASRSAVPRHEAGGPPQRPAAPNRAAKRRPRDIFDRVPRRGNVPFGCPHPGRPDNRELSTSASTVRYRWLPPLRRPSLTPTRHGSGPAVPSPFAAPTSASRASFGVCKTRSRLLLHAEFVAPPLARRTLSLAWSSYAQFASFWHATARPAAFVEEAGRVDRRNRGGPLRPRSPPRRAVGPVCGCGAPGDGPASYRSIVGDTAYSDIGSTAHASGPLRARRDGRGEGVEPRAGHGCTVKRAPHSRWESARRSSSRAALSNRSVSAAWPALRQRRLRLRTTLLDRAPTAIRSCPVGSLASGDGGAGFTAQLQVQPTPDGCARVVCTLSL